ncbi:hypothetical protein V3C99_006046 [Haemonchus contortus]
MSEVSPASFADVTFALIQKVSPRKLKRSDIPNEAFHALREMVSNELSSIPSAELMTPSAGNPGSNGNVSDTVVEPNKLHFGLFEDEDSRMSGCESSEGSQSQYSTEDDITKSLAKGRPLGYSSSASSLSQTNPFPKCTKQSTRCRRLTELRATRRKAAETDEVHIFSCSEEDLPTVFGQWYESLLDGGDQPVKCYHLVINSLKKFFVTNTFGNAVKTMVCDFLRNHVIRSCAELNRQYEGSTTDGERRLRETQLQVLLELYTCYLDPNEPSKVLEIVRKMRIVYFVANARRMRTFLEEQVSDNFIHLIPKIIAEIFDELCIQLPDDLEEFDSVWNKDEDLSFPLFHKASSGSRLQQLDQFIEEIQAPEEGPSNAKGKTTQKATKESKDGDLVKAAADDDAKSPSKKLTQRRKSERPRAIPETPEEKLRVSVKDEKAEVVKATPMAKVCGNPTRHKSRMSELVRISEERARVPRAAALASAKASKAIIQASQSSMPISRESLLGLNTPSPRPRRAKSNLLNKFTNLINNNSLKTEEEDEKPSTRVLRSASLSGNTPVKRSAVTEPAESEPPEKKVRSASIASTSTSTVAPVPVVEIDEIVGPEQLARFQQRVDEINKRSDLDDSQVYHENSFVRTSLFDEEVIPCQPPGQNFQQNRARRVVTSSSAAHLAHTLLNVDNVTPLEVWKLPRSLSSPEKMPRMIRTGVSAIKMKKIQRMRDQGSASSPVESQKSDPLVEVE